MLRRQLIAGLVAGWQNLVTRNRQNLAHLMPPQSTALLLDVHTRMPVAIHGAAAGMQLVPPGSTIKPFVISSLLRAGKLSTEESFFCPASLKIGGRSFDCTHPRLTGAIQVRSALAYSCNCFVAHYARRFQPGELARSLERAGLGALTGWTEPETTGRIRAAVGEQANQLQALGEEPLLLTAAELALGYRTIAIGAERPEMGPIIDGLEDATEYGTAQLARVAGLKVAGKTGSVRTRSGARIAWFAGFAPSRTPKVVVTVMLQGRSGGSDAAPIAGRILEEWRAGKLR